MRIDQTECELIIWDVEGSTPIKKIPKSYMLGASGAILTADCNREDTIRNIDEHIKRFQAVNPRAHYVVAYNKSDLLTEEQKEQFALKKNTFLTSAKEGNNVNRLFTYLAKDILS